MNKLNKEDRYEKLDKLVNAALVVGFVPGVIAGFLIHWFFF